LDNNRRQKVGGWDELISRNKTLERLGEPTYALESSWSVENGSELRDSSQGWSLR
jgi:hypothetical protein